MKKSIPILKRVGLESVEDLLRTAVGFSSKAYQDLPPLLRLSAMSYGDQRFRVRVPNAQGLHHTTHFFMQEYLNLVDWKGLELPLTEKKCKASVKKFEHSPTVLEEWIQLKETLAKFQAERGNETSDDILQACLLPVTLHAVIFSLPSVQVQSGGVTILRWFLACLQASSTHQKNTLVTQ